MCGSFDNVANSATVAKIDNVDIFDIEETLNNSRLYWGKLKNLTLLINQSLTFQCLGDVYASKKCMISTQLHILILNHFDNSGFAWSFFPLAGCGCSTRTAASGSTLRVLSRTARCLSPASIHNAKFDQILNMSLLPQITLNVNWGIWPEYVPLCNQYSSILTTSWKVNCPY